LRGVVEAATSSKAVTADDGSPGSRRCTWAAASWTLARTVSHAWLVVWVSPPDGAGPVPPSAAHPTRPANATAVRRIAARRRVRVVTVNKLSPLGGRRAM